MENVIKVFLGFFLMIAVVMLGIGITTSMITHRNMSTYAENCARKIEESNFAPTVIEELETEAKKEGCELQVEVQTSENNRYVHYGTMTLYYPYEVPVLGIHRTLTVPVDLH